MAEEDETSTTKKHENEKETQVRIQIEKLHHHPHHTQVEGVAWDYTTPGKKKISFELEHLPK